MKQLFAGLVVVTALGVTLASQGRRGGDGIEFGSPPGVAVVNSGTTGNPSNSWFWYRRLNTDQPVVAIEEFYRTKLAALGWRVTYAKADANLALTRYAVGTGTDPQVGFLTVMPLSGLDQMIASIHLVSRTGASPETGRRGGSGAGGDGTAMARAMPSPTARAEMDRLIRESLPPAGETFARRPGVPDAFPKEVLPPRFVVDTVLTSATRTTVVGRVENAGGSAVPAIVLALQARDWHAAEDMYGLMGDAVQSVAKFSTAGAPVTPVPGFHASALLFLTAVPGTHEVDALLTV